MRVLRLSLVSILVLTTAVLVACQSSDRGESATMDSEAEAERSDGHVVDVPVVKRAEALLELASSLPSAAESGD